MLPNYGKRLTTPDEARGNLLGAPGWVRHEPGLASCVG